MRIQQTVVSQHLSSAISAPHQRSGEGLQTVRHIRDATGTFGKASEARLYLFVCVLIVTY